MDIGLAGCRALAIAHDGRPLAQARGGYAPERASDGDLTLDLGALWAATEEAIAQTVQRARSDRPLAICITSTAMAVVPLAVEGGALAPALLGTAPLEDEDLHGGFAGLAADDVVNTLGNRLAAVSPLRALSRWRRDAPLLYGRIWRAVPLATLVGLRLGGACVVDPSLAAGMHMLDVVASTWAGKVLRAVGLAESKLPDIAEAATPMGSVSLPVAEALGLGRDVRIVLGGADYACAALGVGVLQAATGLLSLDRVISLLAAYEASPLVGLLYARGLNTMPHVVPNRWLSQVLTSAGGNVLRWLRDAWLTHEARDAAARGHDFYRRLMDEMPATPTRLVAFPPSEEALLGHVQERRCGGVWGITDKSTRGEIVKAFLEGATLACMDGLESLREAGIGLETLRATGPGARSEPWLQLAADILGVAVEETGVLYPAPLGAAMLAGIGAGVYSSARDAVSTVVHPQRRYEPRPAHREAYAVLRQRYYAYGERLAELDAVD